MSLACHLNLLKLTRGKVCKCEGTLDSSEGYLAAMFVHRERTAVWGADPVAVAVDPINKAVVARGPTGVQGVSLKRVLAGVSTPQHFNTPHISATLL